MDHAAPGELPTGLPPDLAAVQASLLALIGAARCTLDAIEAVVAEPRTFASGAALVQQAVAVAGPLVGALAATFLVPDAPDRR